MNNFIFPFICISFEIYFCVYGMGRSNFHWNYWSTYQSWLWHCFCFGIGAGFAIMMLLVVLLKQNDGNTIKILLVLAFLGGITMLIFSEIIYFIAWRGKKKILKQKLELTIRENSTLGKKQLLNLCIIENRFNFSIEEITCEFEKKYFELVQ